MVMAHDLGRGGAIRRRFAPAISVRATVSALNPCASLPLSIIADERRRHDLPPGFRGGIAQLKAQVSSSKDEIGRKSENEG